MLPDVINGQAHCLYVRYALNCFNLLEGILQHIPSYSTTQAVSNKGCLHSLCCGVSLKQRVTCVTISNKGNAV